MGKLKCERQNGYLVCYPYGKWVKRAIGKTLKTLGAIGFLIFLFVLVYFPEGFIWLFSQAMFETENNASKLQAVEYLNYIRDEQGIPPVQLINLSVVKFRAEYLAHTNLFSHYDVEGKHPGYWFTQLDGGLYGVEENLMERYAIGIGAIPGSIMKVNYTDAVYSLVFNDASSNWGHRDSLLDPCNNYVAMATSYFRNITYSVRYYVVYMVAKWVEWVSPPRYEGGRFTAEGYAAPEMKPKYFAVYYASYENNPASRHSYDVGDLYLCKVLDTPLAKCKDAQEPAGVFSVEKTRDGRWHIKIDASVALDKPGLYTFEIIAEDLRGIKWKPMSPWGDARIGKCRIMEYTVAK